MKSLLATIMLCVLSTVANAGPAVSGGVNQQYGVESLQIMNEVAKIHQGSGEYITKLQIGQQQVAVTTQLGNGCSLQKTYSIERSCQEGVTMMCLPVIELKPKALKKAKSCDGL